MDFVMKEVKRVGLMVKGEDMTVEPIFCLIAHLLVGSWYFERGI